MTWATAEELKDDWFTFNVLVIYPPFNTFGSIIFFLIVYMTSQILFTLSKQMFVVLSDLIQQ